MVNKPVPANPSRVILVNPTKYLGNLLIAGGLMQAYADYCRAQGTALRIVLDAGFRELCEPAFPKGTLVFFPRQDIKQAGLPGKIARYWHTVKTLRAFRADLAFTIEEDPAASHLTRLSGAAFKLGCSPARHKNGYDQVVPVQFEQRPAGRAHRWHSFYDVFATLGMPEPEPAYLKLALEDFPNTLKSKLNQLGWDSEHPTIALHAGATKDYKKWPLAHMTALVEKLQTTGFQPVLIGAGDSDKAANDSIRQTLAGKQCPAPIDLCNQLSLLELAQFLRQCRAMVGNDSGPFHLGSAVGVPGLVLWGPTNQTIWGPLGSQSQIITSSFACDPACNKGHCLHSHRCLTDISPDRIFAAMTALA